MLRWRPSFGTIVVVLGLLWIVLISYAARPTASPTNVRAVRAPVVPVGELSASPRTEQQAR